MSINVHELSPLILGRVLFRYLYQHQSAAGHCSRSAMGLWTDKILTIWPFPDLPNGAYFKDVVFLDVLNRAKKLTANDGFTAQQFNGMLFTGIGFLDNGLLIYLMLVELQKIYQEWEEQNDDLFSTEVTILNLIVRLLMPSGELPQFTRQELNDEAYKRFQARIAEHDRGRFDQNSVWNQAE